MWLYVPTSVSSPASAPSTLLSDECSQALARSCSWRTKSRAPRDWQRVWKQDASIRRLCGPTFARSQQDCSEAVQTWLSAVFPARTCPTPASAPASTASGPGCSSISSEPFARYDPATSTSKTSQPSSPLDPNAAYAAGLMDGEGTIRIQHSTSKYGVRYGIMGDVGMSAKGLPALTFMQERYGGNITKRRNPTTKWAAAYSWRIFGAEAEAFLRNIQPYLILKQQHATLALAFQDLLNQARQENGRVAWTSPLFQAGKEYQAAISVLNQKGPTTAARASDCPEGAFAFLVDGQWMTPQLGLWSQELQPFSGRWPKSGLMRAGAVYARPTLARLMAATAGGASRGTADRWATPRGRDGDKSPRKLDTSHGPHLTAMAAHWATPAARDWRQGDASDETMARNARPLNEQASHWPTPAASDNSRSETSAVNRIAANHQADLPTIVALWQTPSVADTMGGHLSRGGDRSTELLLKGQAQHLAMQWATPMASEARLGYQQRPSGEGQQSLSTEAVDFLSGPQAQPIAGHGRPSSLGGRTLRPQLSALFVEWLMGTPLGMTCVCATGEIVSGDSATQLSRSAQRRRYGSSGTTPSESGLPS